MRKQYTATLKIFYSKMTLNSHHQRLVNITFNEIINVN